jgi:hypothetical protein
MYDVGIRGSAALRNAQLGSRDRETSWEVFFVTVAEGSVRIWITIVAVGTPVLLAIAYLTSPGLLCLIHQPPSTTFHDIPQT